MCQQEDSDKRLSFHSFFIKSSHLNILLMFDYYDFVSFYKREHFFI